MTTGTPNNLRTQTTSFVGRDRELSELASLLGHERIVTLTGPGGCGKTRLACAVATDVLASFPDGVWLVELASIHEPGLVATELAAVFGLRERVGRPWLDAVMDHLAGRRALVVLDNCEQVLESVRAVVTALMAATSGVGVLATSRQALGVAGERVVTIAPLPVPARGANVSDALGSESVQLFIDRVQAARATLTVDPGTVEAAAEVCRSLDGIPLAIELAAARVKVLSVLQVAERISDRFALLTSGGAGPPHHETMYAAINWSYELLDERSRSLLCRMSVFPGGCDIEALREACGAGVGEPEILDTLAELTDRSLVSVHDRGGKARYQQLETIRMFAAERLRAAGDEPDALRGLITWACRFAADAEAGLHGGDEAEWLARVEAEHDNIRAAIRTALDNDPSAAVRLTGSMWRFWHVRGHVEEARGWLEDALDTAPADTGPDHVKALNGAGVMAWTLGDFATAQERYEDALSRARARGDRRSIAATLNNLGALDQHRGRFDDARRRYEESLLLFRELGDGRDAGLTLVNLGGVAYSQGDLDGARTCWELALADLGERPSEGCAHLYNNLAALAHAQGDLAGARRSWEGALTMFRSLGNRQGEAHVLHNLGTVALESERHEQAAGILSEALRIHAELGELVAVSSGIEALAAVAAEAGDLDRAAVLAGAAAGLRERVGALLPEQDALRWSDVSRRAKDLLGEAEWRARWEVGYAMDAAGAIATASQMAGPSQAPSGARADGRRMEREGEFWTITFDGAVIRVRDGRGVRYLGCLLAEPGREVPAIDMVSAERPASALAPSPGASIAGLHGADPLLDPQARAAYAARLAELREELDDAESFSDLERASRAREEIEQLTAELRGATGLRGRTRLRSDPAERARVAVTKATRSAIRRMAADAPELGRHLTATIRTGTYCSYQPDPGAERWVVRPSGPGAQPYPEK